MALAACDTVPKSTAIDATLSRLSAPRSVEKGAASAGDRPLARRPDHQVLAEAGIHAITDVVGRPDAITLTPANVADISVALALLERALGARHILAYKGYDADALRCAIRGVRAVPVIPGRRTRTTHVRYDRTRYKERHLIENAFCRLKDFGRVANRYDKLAANVLSAVAIATSSLTGYY